MDFLTDTFTGAGTPLLSAHSPDVGGAWTKDAGSFTDMGLNPSNECSITGGGNVGYTNAATPPGPNYTARIGMSGDPGVSNEQALSIRKNTAAGNRYEAKFVPPNVLQLNKVLAGATTTLDSATFTLPGYGGPQATIAISATGTSLAVSVNGVPTLTATDSSISAAGKVGLDGIRSPGQPLYLDNLHAFAAVVLFRRTMGLRAGTRGAASGG